MSRRRLALGIVLVVAILSAIVLTTVPGLRAQVGTVLRAAHRRQITLTHRAPRALRVDVVRSYPHDPGAFTQGLLVDGPLLYESTGLYGQSSVRRVDLQTGRVLSSAALPGAFFGEGLAMSSGQLIQLTWKEGIAFCPFSAISGRTLLSRWNELTATVDCSQPVRKPANKRSRTRGSGGYLPHQPV